MYSNFNYTNGIYAGRGGATSSAQKTKREQAADLFNAGRKLAREALAEENAQAEQAELDAEYGPYIGRKT